jgi:transglutaminase-like putative cysteine protease
LEDHRQPVYLDKTALARLMELSKNNLRERLMIEMLFCTGVRISELLNIKLGDIKWDARQIWIRKGKGNKERYVLFTTECRERIKEYLKKRKLENDYLFASRRGGHLSRVWAEMVFRKYSKLLDLGYDVTPHTMRHTFGAYLAMGGFTGEEQLVGIFNTLLEEDNYLKFNIKSTYYGCEAYSGQTDVFFNMTYLTTAEQENFVDEEVTSVLSAIISPGMNDHQKEKAIHDYIVKNVAFDENLDPSSYSAYAALYSKKAVCQGYALLAHKMLSRAGLPVRCINGEGKGENHLWNLVRLDNNWYHLDCTWNDPPPDRPDRVTYNYYNLSDQEIGCDHSWDTGNYPACRSSYYHELNNKLASDPGNYSLWQSLLVETELHFLLPERAAENITVLEEKLHNSVLLHDNVLKLRFNSAGFDPGVLLNSAFSSAARGTACSFFEFTYAPYNRGGGEGYYLLVATFTYRGNGKGWSPWKEEKIVDVDHPFWIITFSQALDENSVNSQNIYIGSEPCGETRLPGIPAPQLTKANQVKLYPPWKQQWDPGVYYLFISPDIKSAGNKNLEQGIRMKFTIQ